MNLIQWETNNNVHAMTNYLSAFNIYTICPYMDIWMIIIHTQLGLFYPGLINEAPGLAVVVCECVFTA